MSHLILQLAGRFVNRQLVVGLRCQHAGRATEAAGGDGAYGYPGGIADEIGGQGDLALAPGQNADGAP